MADWGERCPEGTKCGRGDCPKCAPTSILPSHLRGRRKAGGGGKSASSASLKYTVRLQGALGPMPGTDEYFTIDAAINKARSLRKATTVYYGQLAIADVDAKGIPTYRP